MSKPASSSPATNPGPPTNVIQLGVELGIDPLDLLWMINGKTNHVSNGR